MHTIREHPGIPGRAAELPLDVVRRYEQWKDILRLSGPDGLARLRGLGDSPVDGRGRRASRLGRGYRVVYRVERRGIQVLALLADPPREPRS